MTTKIHAAVDANGQLVRFFITRGQQSDFTKGVALIDGLKASYIVGDKGYDANYIVEAIESNGGVAVIPPKRNRKEQRPYDKALYTARNLVERFFLKLKNFRRIATRYERLSTTYAAMVCLAASVIWLSN